MLKVSRNRSEMSDQITVFAKYKTQHIYWFGRLRTKKGLQGGKTIQQRSEFFASLVPNASTSSLAHALVRSLHTCMCVYYSVSTQLWVAATLLLLLRSWDPWLRRTSRPQCGYILASLNKRTNRIGDLTRYRVSWGSPLMVPLRVHMLSIDYQ